MRYALTALLGLSLPAFGYDTQDAVRAALGELPNTEAIVQSLFSFKNQAELQTIERLRPDFERAFGALSTKAGPALAEAILKHVMPEGVVDAIGSRAFFFDPLIFWFSLKSSARFPEVLDRLWECAHAPPKRYYNRQSAPFWSSLIQHAHWHDAKTLQRLIHFPAEEALAVHEPMVRTVAAKGWHRDPNWRVFVSALALHDNVSVRGYFARHVLSDPYWSDPATPLAERRCAQNWIESYLAEDDDSRNTSRALLTAVLGNPHWGSAPRFRVWVAKMIEADPKLENMKIAVGEIIHGMDGKPHFATPEFIELLDRIILGRTNYDGLKHPAWGWEKILAAAPWRDLPQAARWRQVLGAFALSCEQQLVLQLAEKRRLGIQP
ncbi:hypothetical protein K2X33_04045 [bacterium]|nr:hypothetical protein [bacterium]